MKKIIQFFLIIILLVVLALIIIFVFNPGNSRNKLIGSVINNYLSKNIPDYKPLDNNTVVSDGDQNPLLNTEQEKTLTSFGVDVSQLPTTISPAMQDCFVEKLGESRAMEIVNGATPSATDFFKAQDCLSK